MNNNILGIFNRSIDDKYRIIILKKAGVVKNIEDKIDSSTNIKDIEFHHNLKDEVIIEEIMAVLRIWNPDKFNKHQEFIIKRNGRK